MQISPASREFDMAKLADRVDLVMTLVKVSPTEPTQRVEKWVICKHIDLTRNRVHETIREFRPEIEQIWLFFCPISALMLDCCTI